MTGAPICAATERGHHAVLFAFDETRAAMLARSESIGMKIVEGTGWRRDRCASD